MSSRFFWILLATIVVSEPSFAKKEAGKGLLPEVRIGEGGNETDNDKKALTSEILITRSENKAIDSLQKLIKTKKPGSPENADLLYRLAELYMRRSKSGRFFDMNQNNPVVKMSSFPIPNERGADAIKRAISVFSRIEKENPNFKDMDAVFFNNAFAHQQIGKSKEASILFTRLVEKYPKSPLIADGTLALGELLYDQGKFQLALEQFSKIEKMPKSRVYSYGLYKAAWAYYNLKDSENGIKRLLQVVKSNPALQEGEVPTNRHNLRKEALRDLTIFVGDSYPADKLYAFFEKTTQNSELGSAIMDMAKLYLSHSRQKEMGIFLGEFIDKNPSNPYLVKANLYLVEAYEDLKQRDKVVSHLQAASDLCKANSSWRTQQKPEEAGEHCEKDFRRDSLEIAKKWWEIWLKNKQNVAFSDLTQKSFRLILDNEDPTKPDVKTHFALAELLFQLGKYDEASAEYKFVGERAQEPTLQHDANYGALYSVEKALDKSKEKDPAKDALRKELATIYLTKHPNGKYSFNVRFKMGHIAYEENNFPEAEKWLKPIADSNKDPELKKKSEDLMLDMLNMKKDYAGLQKLSKKIIAGGANEDRKKNMTKILEESHYSEIQDFSKTGEATAAARKLLDFAKEHEGSALAKDSLWQALSLLYANGRPFEGAELSLQYAKKYPQDKKTLDGLKDAAKSYAEIGQLLKAAETLKIIADMDKKHANSHLEMAADFLRLEGRTKESRDIYNKLMQGMDNKNQARMITKIMATYGENTKNPEYQKLQEKILAINMEPYATQILMERAEALLASGKKTQAFDAAKKIMGRNISNDDKAPARLIQAQVLESELVQQSVKAKMDKFAMVLGMKTEKLDKAQTAYLNALSLSKEEKVVRKALAGLDRCYSNYIDSLNNMPMPGGLKPDEKEILKQELTKITTPIQGKKAENEQRLKTLVVVRATTDGKERDYTEFNPEFSIAPSVSYPPAAQFEAYLTAKTDMSPSRVQKGQTKACARTFATKDAKINAILDNANNCYVSKQYDITEKLGLELAKFKETRTLGLYYLSLASEARDQKEKALWLIDELMKTQSENALVQYQKGRLMYQLEDINAAIPFFAKVVDMNIGSAEISTFAAVKAYTEKDFITSTENFSRLTQDQVYNYNMGPLFSEAWAQRGETEKGLQLIAELSAKKKDNVDMLLQQAHLIEAYKSSDIATAKQVYERIGKVTYKMDLKDWIAKKLTYLKGQVPPQGKVTSLDKE
ncbi:tetratricopeptide repeat protein [Bdellovibrio sp. HCB337]|uniref:tetratricopeptide repeat protein n=1 Tax=Bdellovibrio sp. HCB337 TaxID=3394358 RepID=UPI0039A57BA2